MSAASRRAIRAEVTRTHLIELVNAGWSIPVLAAMANLSTATLYQIKNGKSTSIRPSTFRVLYQLHRSLTQGEDMMTEFDKANVGAIIAGEGDWFNAHLLRLIAKADRPNKERLRVLYPEQVAAYEAWFNAPLDVIVD